MAEVAQDPSTSNLPVNEDLPIEKRLYIGGLSSQLTSTEIEEKFSRFGKITKNLEISQKFQNSNSKFGFLEILINSKNWKNLLSTLNGSNWKGSKLKIQEAKPSNFERITNERVNANNSNEDNDKKTRKRIMCEHSKDFNLVNIDNYEANTHWKKLRFDKLIRSMKIRRPNGIILNYDPKNYQKNFKKFKNDDEVSEASLKGVNWDDIVTPEASDSSDYDSSSEDDSSEDDSEESGDYESDENAVEGLFDDGDDIQDEELEGNEIDDDEEEEYGVENTVQSIDEPTDYNNEITTTIEETIPIQSLSQAQPPSIIQQLSTQEQPTQVEEVPIRAQTPEPAKPKSKIDLLIDSIINDGPEVPKQEPKKIFRRRVQKPQKAKPATNTEQNEDQKPDEGQASSSSFSFNFNF